MPTLRTAQWTDESGARMRMKVEGGLHYIRGNRAPHFSLTATTWRNGREDGGGCMHELILEHFPELSDMAAMHLSDIDGLPMHDAANGWYWLAGYFGGAGERYHGGNSTPSKSPEDCLQIWADHVRLSLEEARTAAESIKTKWNWPDMKTAHTAFIAAQIGRWKEEAKACIEKHKLVVYGDKWEA